MEQGGRDRAAAAELLGRSVEGLWKGASAESAVTPKAAPRHFLGQGLCGFSARPHPHCTGAQGNPGALTAPFWMTEHPGPHLQRCMLPQEPLSMTKWLGGGACSFSLNQGRQTSSAKGQVVTDLVCCQSLSQHLGEQNHPRQCGQE